MQPMWEMHFGPPEDLLISPLFQTIKGKVASHWQPRNSAVPLLFAMLATCSHSSGSVCIGDVSSLSLLPHWMGCTSNYGFCWDAAALSTTIHQTGQQFPSLSFFFSLSLNHCGNCHLNPAVHQRRYCAVSAAIWAERKDFAGRIGPLGVSWMMPSQKKKDSFSSAACGFCQARARVWIFIYMGNQAGNVSKCLGRSCPS